MKTYYCANTQCSAHGNCTLDFDCPLFKPTSEKPKANKYQAQKCTYDGLQFDSHKELCRYLELRLLERSGEITGLKRQVKFELIPAQREPDKTGKRGGVIKGKVIEKECAYYADFVYVDSQGNTIVEDVKGYKQGGAYSVFTIKRKLMLYKYGIKIKEI